MLARAALVVVTGLAAPPTLATAQGREPRLTVVRHVWIERLPLRAALVIGAPDGSQNRVRYRCGLSACDVDAAWWRGPGRYAIWLGRARVQVELSSDDGEILVWPATRTELSVTIRRTVDGLTLEWLETDAGWVLEIVNDTDHVLALPLFDSVAEVEIVALASDEETRRIDRHPCPHTIEGAIPVPVRSRVRYGRAVFPRRGPPLRPDRSYDLVFILVDASAPRDERREYLATVRIGARTRPRP